MSSQRQSPDEKEWSTVPNRKRSSHSKHQHRQRTSSSSSQGSRWDNNNESPEQHRQRKNSSSSQGSRWDNTSHYERQRKNSSSSQGSRWENLRDSSSSVGSSGYQPSRQQQQQQQRKNSSSSSQGQQNQRNSSKKEPKQHRRDSGGGATIHCVGHPETTSEQTAIRVLAALLPSTYHLLHNFELSARPGAMAYEYDIVAVGTYCVFHIEVKHYQGCIRGDHHRWKFENGHVFPSPIPLANKKSKIIASKLQASSQNDSNSSNWRRSSESRRVPFVDTILLITDDKASVHIRQEDQENRVWVLGSSDRSNEALLRRLTDPRQLSSPMRNDHMFTPEEQSQIVTDILGTNPVPKTPKLEEIGLYDVLEKIAQYDTCCGRYRNKVVVYLAAHKYINTRPKTVLKVFSLDLYTPDREQQLASIFHDQEALRLLGSHPNIIQTGDFFASSANTTDFVLPHEYLEQGRTLAELLEQTQRPGGNDDDNYEHQQQYLLTWPNKLYIMGAIAQGLQHCHNNGVIHRDVKPHCVVVAPPLSQSHLKQQEACAKFTRRDSLDPSTFVTPNQSFALQPDENVLVKLVNFDLSRILDSKFDDDKSIMQDLKERLDPQYTAPEVWKDPWSGASEQSDIFSLGLLFYRLLTDNRHIPFEHSDETANTKKAGEYESDNVSLDVSLLMKVMISTTDNDNETKVPPPPTESMAQKLVQMLQKMTQANLEDRYSNMQEIIQELDELNQQYKEVGGRTRSLLRYSVAHLCKLLDDDDDPTVL